MSTLADCITSHTVIRPPVLLLRGANQQCGVVLREVISVADAQRNIVPQPLKHNSGPSLHRAGPSNIGFVFNDCMGGGLHNDWTGNRD